MNQVLDDSSSSGDDDDFFFDVVNVVIEDEFDEEPKHGGSVHGHRVLQRDRQAGHERLYQDYFADNPTYAPNYFRRSMRCNTFFLKKYVCIYIYVCV
jgi:hypothetical protein